MALQTYELRRPQHKKINYGLNECTPLQGKAPGGHHLITWGRSYLFAFCLQPTVFRLQLYLTVLKPSKRQFLKAEMATSLLSLSRHTVCSLCSSHIVAVTNTIS